MQAVKTAWIILIFWYHPQLFRHYQVFRKSVEKYLKPTITVKILRGRILLKIIYKQFIIKNLRVK